jgi:membrane-bound inhibitor of C-type lysozyme
MTTRMEPTPNLLSKSRRQPESQPDVVGRYRSLQARVVSGHPNRMWATSLRHEVKEYGCVAIAAFALLAACAPERPPGVVRVTYNCDEGHGFVARYERDGQVILELDDGEWVLPEVSAAAGTRYDDGTRELQLHGRQATLRGTAATYSNCVARDWQESEPG